MTRSTTVEATRRHVIQGLAASAGAAGGLNLANAPVARARTEEVYNPKLDDVEKRLNKLATKSNNSVGYSGRPNIGTMVESHVQGVARYRGYYVLTHNNKGYSTGRLLILNRDKKKMVQDLRTPIEHYNHPGGVQVIGDFLAVAIEKSDASKSRVVFYNLSNMSDRTAPSLLTPMIDGNGAGAVGICNITLNGQEIYVVATISGKTVKIYTSNAVTLADDSLTLTKAFEGKVAEDGYNGINLLAQEDNKVFLVGMRTTSAWTGNKDYLDLYEVRMDAGKISSKKKAWHMTVQHDNGAISGQAGSHFRWASSVRVMSSNELQVHVGQRNFVADHWYKNTLS